MKMILTKVTAINFRQVIYFIMGIYMLVTGIMEKDSMIGSISLLLFYQTIFNTCFFGFCTLSNRSDKVRNKQTT